MNSVDFGDGSALGFIGDGDISQVIIGWKLLLTAELKEVVGKASVIIVDGKLDNGVIGLVGLNDGAGGVQVAPADPTNHLSQQMKGAFLGGEIREREASVGLNYAYGGQTG